MYGRTRKKKKKADPCESASFGQIQWRLRRLKEDYFLIISETIDSKLLERCIARCGGYLRHLSMDLTQSARWYR